MVQFSSERHPPIFQNVSQYNPFHFLSIIWKTIVLTIMFKFDLVLMKFFQN